MHLGIDYGSKLAGTTAICYQQGKELIVIQSEKKRDADAFVKEVVQQLEPTKIFIDAPLSLPGVYFGKGEDYFYRACDREIRAMSPMFIGGLTARAIKLTRELEKNGVACFESYPSGLVKELEELQSDYNKKSMVNTKLIKILEELTNRTIKSVGNYHQIDAVLCWYIGMRYLSGTAKVIGDKDEGQIFV